MKHHRDHVLRRSVDQHGFSHAHTRIRSHTTPNSYIRINLCICSLSYCGALRKLVLILIRLGAGNPGGLCAFVRHFKVI